MAWVQVGIESLDERRQRPSMSEAMASGPRGKMMDQRGPSETTRRGLLKLARGAAVAMSMAAGLGGTSIVVAQESSPVASPMAGEGLEGRYVVARLRQLKADVSAAEIMDLIEEGFVPLLQEIPGFVSYIGVAEPDSQNTAFIGVFADKAGGDESNRVAAEYLEENGYDWFEGEPDVVEGVIEVAAESTS